MQYDDIKSVGIINLAEEAGEPDPGANTEAKSQQVKRGESAKACDGAKYGRTAAHLNQAQTPL